MSPLRILHVDDEPDIRDVVEMSLSLDPVFSVRGCGSGEEAISAAASWTPDLVLLDVMMPNMDGPTTLARLRGTPKTAAIPVVFMTARAQPRELEHFVSLGAEGVIAKPFDPMTLASAVRSYVRTADIVTATRREAFLERARNEAAALAKCRESLADEMKAPIALERIRGIAHGLAGAGGIFGFHEVSKDAAALEQAILDHADRHDTITRIVPALERLVSRIAGL
jgi:CheY-like chemotaxis protein